MEGPLSVRRTWFDYNTLMTPAVYYEKIHRMPPDSARVKQMRWMYGKTPGREDLPLAECLVEGDCRTDIPPDAQPPPSGYIPVPPLPTPPGSSGKESPPKPKPKKRRQPPMPKSALPVSTAKKSAERQRPPRRTAARNGSWRFAAEQQ